MLSEEAQREATGASSSTVTCARGCHALQRRCARRARSVTATCSLCSKTHVSVSRAAAESLTERVGAHNLRQVARCTPRCYVFAPWLCWSPVGDKLRSADPRSQAPVHQELQTPRVLRLSAPREGRRFRAAVVRIHSSRAPRPTLWSAPGPHSEKSGAATPWFGPSRAISVILEIDNWAGVGEFGLPLAVAGERSN